VYSFENGTYEGNPFLILFKDGKPVFDEAEHIKGLKFGIKKAKMIINAMTQIEEFFNSKGVKPPKDSEIYIPPGKYNIPCQCRKYSDFQRGDFIIERPYLRIWDNYARIGFGLVKAEGLITLKNQIEDFIKKGDFIEDIDSPTSHNVVSNIIFKEKLKEQLDGALETLTSREKRVLELRYGIATDRPHTLEEIGKVFRVSYERIRQIEAKALRKLRHQVEAND